MTIDYPILVAPHGFANPPKKIPTWCGFKAKTIYSMGDPILYSQQGQTPFDIAFAKKFDHLIKLLSLHSEGTLPAPPLTQHQPPPADTEVDDGYDENMTSSSAASDVILSSPSRYRGIYAVSYRHPAV